MRSPLSVHCWPCPLRCCPAAGQLVSARPSFPSYKYSELQPPVLATPLTDTTRRPSGKSSSRKSLVSSLSSGQSAHTVPPHLCPSTSASLLFVLHHYYRGQSNTTFIVTPNPFRIAQFTINRKKYSSIANVEISLHFIHTRIAKYIVLY